MIKRLSRQINTITGAALLISFFSLLSKILAILRDHLLAKYFGASADLDIYYAAFRLPDFIMNLLILGVVSAGLIPIMSRLLAKENEENKQKFWDLLNNLVNLYLLTFTFLTIIFFIFIYPIMHFLTPGFSAEQLDQVVKLTRIMFVSPLLLGLSSLFSSGVQVFKQYILYSLAPFLYNLGIIFGIIFLSPIYGIEGLVYGVLIGAFLHLLIQWSGMYHLGYKYKFYLDIHDKALKKLLNLALPRFFTLALFQVNIIVITIVASTLSEGSLSIFNFANNLQSLPLSLFAIPFAIASFPLLTKYYHRNEIDNYEELFFRTLKKIIFFIVPSTIIFILLRAQIVRLVLGSGRFDWHDTILTMETLGIFLISLLAQSVSPLLTRAFYAVENSLYPFLVVLLSSIFNAIFAFTFVNLPVPSIFHEYLQCQSLGVIGLALAFTLSSIIQAFLLWLLLRIKILKKKRNYGVFIFLLKNLFASILMGLALEIAKLFWGKHFPLSEYWQVLGQVIFALFWAFIIYYLVMKVLKVDEFIFWEKKIKRFINKYLYGDK